MDAQPVKRYGKYELLDRLGEGGMAEVFLARVDGPMGVSRFVALKRILPHQSRDPALAEMFVDEARLVSRLSHPAIVGVQDFGIEDGCYYLAMEYVEGVDLRQVIRMALSRKQAIPAECVLFIVAQVARGLDYAYSLAGTDGQPLEIVHRDVSPANVLLSFGGDVKLADFGVARARHRLSSTQSGTIKGKYRYMSPEQSHGDPLDHRSDLFTLGTLTFESLALEAAFLGEDDMSSMRLVQLGLPAKRLNAALPADIVPLVEKAMQVDREQRWERGNQMAEAAERILRARDPAFGPPQLAKFLQGLFAAEMTERRDKMRRHEAGERTASGKRALSHEPPTRRITTDPKSQPPPEPRIDKWRAWMLAFTGVALAAMGLVIFRMSFQPPSAAPTPLATLPSTPAGVGSITVESTPPGAQVTVDGERLAQPTPVTRTGLDAGRPHRVRLELPGYHDDVRQVVVRAGADELVRRTLLPAPRTIMVTSTPEGSTVSVDGKPSGTTPVAISVEPGRSYAIDVSKPGLADWHRVVGVNASTPLVLEARLEPLSPHGVGALDLMSQPWADISIDGKPAGQTPRRDIKLSAGPHKVVLTNPGFPPRSMNVSIVPNKTVTRSISFGP
jgi:serine/threonine-protein kinase